MNFRPGHDLYWNSAFRCPGWTLCRREDWTLRRWVEGGCPERGKVAMGEGCPKAEGRSMTKPSRHHCGQYIAWRRIHGSTLHNSIRPFILLKHHISNR